MAMRECGYCLELITQDGDAWVDYTNGDVCSGDSDGVNENELHVYFSPSEGFDPGPCKNYVHDAEPGDDGDELYDWSCARCFHERKDHHE